MVKFDIAVDPLKVLICCKQFLGLSVIAIGEKNSLFKHPKLIWKRYLLISEKCN